MFKSSLLMDFENFRTAEPEERITLVDRICNQFNSFEFKPNEMDIIHDILSFLAMDIEVSIRKIVAESLKDNPEIPEFLARRLAADVTEVSTPILEFSQVLSDEELQEIIKSTGEVAKLTSIARRKSVSENLSYALIEKQIDDVVVTLMNNTGAKISTKGQELIFNVFSSSTDVLDAMVKRGGLSPSLASRMVSYVSESVSKNLASIYSIQTEVVEKSVNEAESHYNIDVLCDNLSEESAKQLAARLYVDEKLSHSVILRTLAKGELNFFYHTITILAGITFDNSKKLLEEGDEKAFEALFKAANMPTTMSKACYMILQLTYKETNIEPGTDAHYRYLIENILENGYDKNIPNMRYFLALLNSLRKKLQ